jgi:hypothetical protein
VFRGGEHGAAGQPLEGAAVDHHVERPMRRALREIVLRDTKSAMHLGRRRFPQKAISKSPLVLDRRQREIGGEHVAAALGIGHGIRVEPTAREPNPSALFVRKAQEA